MSTAVEEAVVLKLGADATLATLAPGGVWVDLAPPTVAAQTHIIVSIQSDRDSYALERDRTMETAELMVKAIAQGKTPAAALAAYARIDALLQGGTLTFSDGTLMDVSRTERIRYPEIDGDLVYQHVGGLYEIWVSR